MARITAGSNFVSLAPGYVAQRMVPLIVLLVPAVQGTDLADLGRLELVLVIGALAGAAGPLGVDVGLVLARAEHKHPRRLVALTAGTGALIACIGAVAYGDSAGFIVAATAIGAAFSGTSTAFASLRGARAHGRWNLTSILWLAICFLGTIGASNSDHLVEILGLCLFAGAIPAMCSPVSCGTAYSSRYLLRQGRPTIVLALATFWLALGDRFIVARLNGLTAVGQYGIASRLVMPLVGLAGLLVVWWGAEIAHRNYLWMTSTRRQLRRIVLVGVLLSALIVVGLESVGLGAALAGRSLVVCECLLIATCGLWVVGFLEMSEDFMRHDTSAAALASVGAVVVNVVLNLLLIPVWGIEGAAFASMLSQLTLISIVVGFRERGLSGTDGDVDHAAA